MPESSESARALHVPDRARRAQLVVLSASGLCLAPAAALARWHAQLAASGHELHPPWLSIVTVVAAIILPAALVASIVSLFVGKARRRARAAILACQMVVTLGGVYALLLMTLFDVAPVAYARSRDGLTEYWYIRHLFGGAVYTSERGSLVLNRAYDADVSACTGSCTVHFVWRARDRSPTLERSDRVPVHVGNPLVDFFGAMQPQ